MSNQNKNEMDFKKKLELNSDKFTTALVSIIFVACFFSSIAVSNNKSAEDIENARLAVEKWIETQATISREKRDFELSKETLNERIDLVKREIDSLRGKIDQVKENIAQTDKKRAEIFAENEKLKKASNSLSNILVALEERTKQLLKRLPDTIRERVKPLSQRLPDDAGQNKLSISERFQNVVGILNEIDKFNREISLTSEVQKLADGSSVEVTALYIGIGQGYYANAGGNIAGTATASDNGWVWKPANEAAGQIADAIAILKNEKVACFVQLPVEIK